MSTVKKTLYVTIVSVAIAFAALLFKMTGTFEPELQSEQSTEGDCSPIITGNEGDVTINGQGGENC